MGQYCLVVFDSSLNQTPVPKGGRQTWPEIKGGLGRGPGQGQRPYIRRQCTAIHYLCDAYLGTPYPSY